MTPTLLQSVLRRVARLADDPTTPTGSDAELLRRFAEAQDETAFRLLLDRHAPLAWAVCRQMLPNPADAEDAFQATFLALVQSAKKLGKVKSVGGWLHGVAVRVCLKVRRSAARRKTREERAAKAESEVPPPAWDDLHAVVHEEIERLPAVLRTVFVLCELEGQQQPDVATRLNCKLGTVSGRLTRARQALLKALTARGLAPMVAVGSVTLSGTATAVPPSVLGLAATLTKAGTDPALVIPSTVYKLAKFATEGTLMKLKMLVAAGIAAAGLMVTTAGWAEAQPGPAVNEPIRPQPKLPQSQQPPANPDDAPPRPARSALLLPAPAGDGGEGETGPAQPARPPVPPRPPMPPLPPQDQTLPLAREPRGPQPRVEHMVRDGVESKDELIKLIKEEQATGWEFTGEVQVGKKAVLVFKRPKGVPMAWGSGGGPAGMPGGMSGPGLPPPAAPNRRGFGESDGGGAGPSPAQPPRPPMPPLPPQRERDRIPPPPRRAGDGESGSADLVLPVREPFPPRDRVDPLNQAADRLPSSLPLGSTAVPPYREEQNVPVKSPTLGADGPTTGVSPLQSVKGRAGELHVIELQHAALDMMAKHIRQFFEVEVSMDDDTNSLVIRCDEKTLVEVMKLLKNLDKPGKKPRGNNFEGRGHFYPLTQPGLMTQPGHLPPPSAGSSVTRPSSPSY